MVLPLLYGISALPFRLLYVLSDVAFLFLYHILKYRRAVVANNLKRSFPHKSETELTVIGKGFYRHLCDLGFETLKTLTITEEHVRARIKFEGIDLFHRLAAESKSAIIAMGHFGNWELAGAGFAVYAPHPLYVIYHPLKNPYFDRLLNHMRKRLGNGLYPMKLAARNMVSNRHSLTATAFIADQSPHPDHAHWIDFLGQDTAVFRGLGKLSKTFNYPVVYIRSGRDPKRGHHTISAEMLIENPSEFSEVEIIKKYMERLEKDISEYPEQWLWSHRRWKHQRKTLSS